MDKQTIADELAALAGWRPTNYEAWHGPGGVLPVGIHPYPVGSLDALEAFRRERLPTFRWLEVTFTRIGVRATLLNGPHVREHTSPLCPDEWTARASALIAAAKENKT